MRNKIPLRSWSLSAVLAGNRAVLAPWHCFGGSSAQETSPLLHPSIGTILCADQIVGAAKADSLAIGHNPGWVATPKQYTSMLTHFADLGRMTGRVNPTWY